MIQGNKKDITALQIALRWKEKADLENVQSLKLRWVRGKLRVRTSLKYRDCDVPCPCVYLEPSPQDSLSCCYQPQTNMLCVAGGLCYRSGHL